MARLVKVFRPKKGVDPDKCREPIVLTRREDGGPRQMDLVFAPKEDDRLYMGERERPSLGVGEMW